MRWGLRLYRWARSTVVDWKPCFGVSIAYSLTMGERGRVVVTRDGRRQFLYIKTVSSLPVRLEYGPSVLDSLFELHDAYEHWIETSARSDWIISADFDHKILIWYGPQELSWIYETRADLTSLIVPAWPGWEVRVAYHGLDSVAEELALPVEPMQVRHADAQAVLAELGASLKRDLSGEDTFLITVASEGIESFLVGDSYMLCEYGLPFLDPAQIVELLTPCASAQFIEVTPNAGLHIDMDSRTVLYWSGYLARRNAEVAQLVSSDGYQRAHLEGELSAQLALIDSLIETAFTRERSQRLRQLANRRLWGLEVDALQTAWFRSSSREEPLESEWPIDPALFRARLEDSLAQTLGTGVEELAQTPVVEGRTAREFVADVSGSR